MPNGAFLENSRVGGWGAIARDSTGEIVFAAADKMDCAADGLHSEATALQNGIRIADQLGIGRLIISTDSQILKMAIESSSFDQARLGQLFLDIKFGNDAQDGSPYAHPLGSRGDPFASAYSA